MSENKIDNIVGELRGEEERLKGKLVDLKKQVDEVNRELKSVRSGLAGLVGKTPGRKRGSKKRAAQEKETSQEDETAEEVEAPRDKPRAGRGERVTEITFDEFP